MLTKEKEIQMISNMFKRKQQKQKKELKQEKEFYMKYLFKQQTIDEYITNNKERQG